MIPSTAPRPSGVRCAVCCVLQGSVDLDKNDMAARLCYCCLDSTAPLTAEQLCFHFEMLLLYSVWYEELKPLHIALFSSSRSGSLGLSMDYEIYSTWDARPCSTPVMLSADFCTVGP